LRRPLASLIGGFALAAALALTSAGCGAAHSASSAPPPTSSTSPATPSTPVGGATQTAKRQPVTPRRQRPRRRPQGAPIGATQRVDARGSTLSVTVTAVLDPLRDSGAALVRGTRAAGVRVTIRDEAGATYDSTASGDLSIATSAGPASPLFIRQGVCQTPLADFESLIGVGETRTGCVGFAVPGHARILSVRFSPHSRAPGSVAWR
jgi:hypothetical protein